MNIETKKTLCRYTVYILFWTLVILLGVWLGKGAGTGSGGGPGSGSGFSGSGTGRGSGSGGTGTGTDQGDGPGKGKGKEKASESPVYVPQKKAAANPAKGSELKKKSVKAPARTAKKAPMRILSKEETSEDAATIYIAKKSPGGNSGGGGGTEVGFFGMTVSGSVLFLLDTSGSMISSTRDGNMTRIQLVKREMGQTLKQKYDESRIKRNNDSFRIVTFSHLCTFLPDPGAANLRFSSSAHLVTAAKYVDALQSGGSTSMRLAWESILPLIRREEIKTVYFLSDGEPTDCAAPELMGYLKATVPKVRIHTISMGQPSALLKRIAAQHGGIYREVY